VLAAAASDVAGEDAMAMHPLCPLHDSLLPLDTSSLKSRQLTHSLELLQQSAEDDEGECGVRNVGGGSASQQGPPAIATAARCLP
jgi:hypothetical protein